MIHVLPILYLLLLGALLVDCWRRQRQPVWHFVLLIPVVGPVAYIAYHFFLASAEPVKRPELPSEELATAVLLVRVMGVDHVRTETERSTIVEELKTRFGLAPDVAQALLVQAEHVSDSAVAVDQYTRALCEQLPRARRPGVVEMLWRVAYADGVKDEFEEHLVRKLSGLLYVSQEDFVEARRRVEADLRA